MTDPRRALPSVDRLLTSDPFAALLEAYPRGRVVEAARAAVDEVRAVLAEREARGEGTSPAEMLPDVQDPETYALLGRRYLEAADRPSLRRVINATGVVLHTNLGRAPLAEAAREAMAEAARGYSNLEYDLGKGSRGSRYDHCVGLLTELTGAEDALVVNNCAGALMLTLNQVAQGQGVAVSRGELVEIGGGFRVPEVMARSGARLVEVGSTNRTRPADYREALEAGGVAALLKVHRSNFRISGFTEDATVAELAALARDTGVPLVYDLGSGLLADPAALGLPDEPRAADALAAGADVVAISGDKLLGGPQAGILLGRRDLVRALRRNPMTRALRVDKVTLAGLEATLRLYRDPASALRQIPALRALSRRADELERRARALAEALGEGADALPSQGAVGGGTYPGVTLPSWGVALEPAGAHAADASGADASPADKSPTTGSSGPHRLAELLRSAPTPVVGRIVDDRLVLDLRTVEEDEEPLLAASVAWARRRESRGAA